MIPVEPKADLETDFETTPKNRRILVIDDNPEIHDDFRKVLCEKAPDAVLERMEERFFGEVPTSIETYELDSAYQGAEGVAKVRDALARGHHYAVAFVDMRMPPGWDGVETITKLWEVDPQIQVVICTAYSDTSWEEILARLGASDRLLILKKPFDTAEVCQLACALTEKWSLARLAHLKLSQLKGMVGEQLHEVTIGNLRLRAEIDERRQAEGALRISEERYALAAAGSNDGLWDWDLAAGSIYLSTRWKSSLGFPAEAISSDPGEWFGRVHPEDLPGLKARLHDHLHGTSRHFEAEYRVRHKDGQYRWMLCRGLAVRSPTAVAVRIAGSQTDITDRRRAEEQLRHDALHDALTGLANRALLSERLRLCLLRAKREPDYRFAVLFTDLDRFKLINDTLGHTAGDQLLVGISQRLLHCIRATDFIAHLGANDLARLGGDEFVVLLDGLRGDGDVLRVAKRLQDTLKEPFIIGGREVFSGMSIGIAAGSADYDNPEDILRDADTALYQVKASGRGGCEFFDPSMHAAAMSRWWMENALRRAIERNELRLVYQPVVSVASGELQAFEALLRWTHPERGAISPADFIPVAEETGLINLLGDWVLRTAVAQLALWAPYLASRPDFSVAVNVSGKQLSQPALGDFISDLLSALAIPASRLRLEVTESALMEKGLSTKMVARLVELDLKLHLDDFGTGYSSLSYLHTLPVNALKIDRSFIDRMTHDSTSAAIVQSIITLAHTLGAEVIAEGVEKVEQLEQLRRLDCDAAQGYYFNRPLEVDKATALLLPPGSTARALLAPGDDAHLVRDLQ
jgi:diguanylate cyclase (GGDEF)-like protein/PAS domain S-box-containing protein